MIINFFYKDLEICYNDAKLAKAMTNGDTIDFQQVSTKDDVLEGKSYDVLHNIHEIEPIILREILCHSDLSKIQGLEEIFISIIREVKEDHDDYSAYLDIVRDVLTSNHLNLKDIMLYLKSKYYEVSTKFLLAFLDILDTKELDVFRTCHNLDLIEVIYNEQRHDLMRKLLDVCDTSFLEEFKKSLTQKPHFIKPTTIYAIQRNNTKLLKEILSGNQFSAEDKNDFLKLAKEHDSKIVKLILSYDNQYEIHKNLNKAIKNHNNDEVDKLLVKIIDHNVDVFGYGTLLHQAIKYNNYYLASLLLNCYPEKQTFDIDNSHKAYALIFAIEQNRLDCVEMLAAHGADPIKYTDISEDEFLSSSATSRDMVTILKDYFTKIKAYPIDDSFPVWEASDDDYNIDIQIQDFIREHDQSSYEMWS